MTDLEEFGDTRRDAIAYVACVARHDRDGIHAITKHTGDLDAICLHLAALVIEAVTTEPQVDVETYLAESLTKARRT